MESETGSRIPPYRPTAVPTLTIDVVTLFPEVIAPYVAASIPGRAAAAGLVSSAWCSCETSPTTATRRWTTTRMAAAREWC